MLNFIRRKSMPGNSMLLTPSLEPTRSGVAFCSGLPSRSILEILPSCVSQSTNEDKAFGNDICAICLDSMNERSNVIKLKNCSHHFHFDCVFDCARCVIGGFFCPLCKTLVAEGKGSGPAGTLSWAIYPKGCGDVACVGYEDCEAVVIDYLIPSGIQNENHPSPGQVYEGTRRFSFFPLTEEGTVLLDMLIRSFENGHTFTVGTSLTTGLHNVVVWSGIHHKTRPDGGESLHGWPDAGYFLRVFDELEAKGVLPRADQQEIIKKCRANTLRTITNGGAYQQMLQRNIL